MHIPDNYLSPATCATMIAAMAPIWAVSLHKVRVQVEEKKATVPLIGVGASLSFLLMMFNVPVIGGTTAHAVGATLLAIMLGPWASCLAITIALFLQALLFGDGGVLAFGANVFNMGFIMPFAGYAVYAVGRRFKHDNIGAFVGGYVGINVAALCAGIELGLQPLLAHTASGTPLYNPYPLSVTIPAMTGAHLLIIGWIEAAVTLVVYQFIKRYSRDELYQEPATGGRLARFWLPLLGVLAFLSPVGLLASGTAWGEWNGQELLSKMQADQLGNQLPSGFKHGIKFNALFSDYGLSGINSVVGYILSAVVALLIIAVVVKIWSVRHAEHV